MSIFDTLMKEVQGEAKNMEKQASATPDHDANLALLNSLREGITEDATTSRLMKHASDAAVVFTKTASENFKAALDTEEFAVKVANLIIEKLALDTSVDVIPDSVATSNIPTPLQNPQTASVESSKAPVPAEINNLRSETGKLLNSVGLTAEGTAGGTTTNPEVAKQAAAAGVDLQVLSELAEQYIDLV